MTILSDTARRVSELPQMLLLLRIANWVMSSTGRIMAGEDAGVVSYRAECAKIANGRLAQCHTLVTTFR